MKSILLAGVAAIALAATSAFAADMQLKAAPYVAPAGYDWSGFYIGAHIGYAWSSVNTSDYDSTLTLVSQNSFTSNGVFGGGQAGYNWVLTPQWLLGVEIDGSVAGYSTDVTGCSANGCSTSHVVTDDFFTARGRLGYIWNNFLLYGTGGAAWVNHHTDRTVIAVTNPMAAGVVGMTSTSSGFSAGWAAGGGIEWGFAPHWTAKIEYIHMGFDNVTSDYNYPGFATSTRHNTSNVSDDTVKIGVNWLFTQK